MSTSTTSVTGGTSDEPSTPGAGPARTPAGDALTDLVLPVFELNGEFLAAAEMMTRPVGLTPALWQVLGATLNEALPVAEIARRVGLGLARQSVQRVADLLVDQGWAVYRDNPAHRRAKLLEPTPQGRASLRRLAAAQHAWANAVAGTVGEGELRHALSLVRQIIDTSRAYRSSHGPDLLPSLHTDRSARRPGDYASESS